LAARRLRAVRTIELRRPSASALRRLPRGSWIGRPDPAGTQVVKELYRPAVVDAVAGRATLTDASSRLTGEAIGTTAPIGEG
jgi:hypothetical protein